MGSHKSGGVRGTPPPPIFVCSPGEAEGALRVKSASMLSIMLYFVKCFLSMLRRTCRAGVGSGGRGLPAGQFTTSSTLTTWAIVPT